MLQQAQQYMPKVLSAFLDEHGMAHPAESVARRACYLFCRLAKYLRLQMKPLLPDILQVGVIIVPGILWQKLLRLQMTPLGPGALQVRGRCVL